jgi:hypothetical protein
MIEHSIGMGHRRPAVSMTTWRETLMALALVASCVAGTAWLIARLDVLHQAATAASQAQQGRDG